MRKILKPAFFNRPAPEVARDLLGKYLVRKIGRQEIALPITETEAYEGPDDRASHASRGRTPRTEVMFGKPGIWYVYFIYGMYEMLNIVTGPEGHPAAVLIRGVGEYNGPGKLTRALEITRKQNKQGAEQETGLWIEDRGDKVPESEIEKTARIGVAYAGPEWANKEYRFVWNQK